MALPQLLTPADLAPFADIAPALAAAMIDDAVALAWLHAPGLELIAQEEPRWAMAKAIVRGAVLRWHTAGDDGLTSHSVTDGPFSEQQSFAPRRGMYYPSEIAQLKQLVRGAEEGKAFTVSLTGTADAPAPDWFGFNH